MHNFLLFQLFPPTIIAPKKAAKCNHTHHKLSYVLNALHWSASAAPAFLRELNDFVAPAAPDGECQVIVVFRASSKHAEQKYQLS